MDLERTITLNNKKTVNLVEYLARIHLSGKLKLTHRDFGKRKILEEKFGVTEIPIRSFPFEYLLLSHPEFKRSQLELFWTIDEEDNVVAYRRLNAFERFHAFDIMCIDLRKSAEDASINLKFNKDRFFLSEVLDPIKNEKILIFLGSRNSGRNIFLEESRYESVLEISGSNFKDKESLNALVGSAPGYIGSDEPTKFAKKLKNEKFDALVIKDAELADPFLLSSFLDDFSRGIFEEKTGKLGSIKVDMPAVLIFNIRVEPRMSLLNSSLEEKKDWAASLRNEEGKVRISQNLIDLCDGIWLFPQIFENKKLALRFFDEKFAQIICKYKLDNKKIDEIVMNDVNLQEVEEASKRKLLDSKGVITERAKIGKSAFEKFILSLKKEPYFGQERAVKALMSLLALKIEDRTEKPVSAMFVGPPGVGKTELAERLGSSVDNFVRIDANQISGRLLDPATSPLFSGLQASSAGVVLIDEVEKLSNKEILELLQILGEARLVNPRNGKTYSLQDYIFIFTTNYLYDAENLTEEEIREKFTEPIRTREAFPREFIDRIDKIVAFRLFDEKELYKIGLKLSKNKISEKEIKDISKKAKSIRSLKNAINSRIGEKATEKLLKEYGYSLDELLL